MLVKVSWFVVVVEAQRRKASVPLVIWIRKIKGEEAFSRVAII